MLGCIEGHTGVGLRTVGPGDRSFVKGINRLPWSIWRFDLFDPGPDSLLSVPGAEEMIVESGPSGTRHQTYVFGKYTVLAVSTHWIYVAPTDAFSIQAYDRDGRLRRVIRRDETPRRVSRSDVRHWVDQYLATLDRPPEEKAQMRRTASELSVAETMPAFRWVVADAEDNLWVEEWKDVGVEQGRFSVFRPDGAWLGSIAMPPGLSQMRGRYDEQSMEIGSDYVLGVWTDEYGVQQVRLYGLHKGVTADHSRGESGQMPD